MTLHRILFATSNRGKVADVRSFVGGERYAILSPEQIVGRGEPPAVEEGVSSYRENAALKAVAYLGWSGLPSIGDDTGLEVEALGGAPGIISARYAGVGASPRENTEKLLALLSGESNRRALFRAVVVLVTPAGVRYEAEGILHGAIVREPRGGGGFGYDNVFEVEGTGQTLAELKEAGSGVVTHRHRALRALFEQLDR
jgi:XTP/dITP diphosphohydrolase